MIIKQYEILPSLEGAWYIMADDWWDNSLFCSAFQLLYEKNNIETLFLTQKAVGA